MVMVELIDYSIWVVELNVYEHSNNNIESEWHVDQQHSILIQEHGYAAAGRLCYI